MITFDMLYHSILLEFIICRASCLLALEFVFTDTICIFIKLLFSLLNSIFTTDFVKIGFIKLHDEIHIFHKLSAVVTSPLTEHGFYVKRQDFK